jgi:hypothetical protein
MGALSPSKKLADFSVSMPVFFAWFRAVPPDWYSARAPFCCNANLFVGGGCEGDDVVYWYLIQ